MALTTAEQEYVRSWIDKELRQKSFQQVMKEMVKLQEYVDKSGWDAFVGCLYFHGGGFFYIGKYFIGVLTCIAGYAVTMYCTWLIISSALSYFWDFGRRWREVLVWLVCNELYDVVLGIWAGIWAVKVRERSIVALELLRERYAEDCRGKQ